MLFGARQYSLQLNLVVEKAMCCRCSVRPVFRRESPSYLGDPTSRNQQDAHFCDSPGVQTGEPAFHTDTFPPSLLVPVEENGDPTHHQREQEAYDLLRQLKPCPVDQQELHLRRLAGLDISPSYLAGAQKATAQVQAHNAQPLAEEDPTEDLLQDDLAGETIYRWEPVSPKSL